MIRNKGKQPQNVAMTTFVNRNPLKGMPFLNNCIIESRTGPGFHFFTDDKHHKPRRCVLQLTLSGRCIFRSSKDKAWQSCEPGHAIAFIQPLEQIEIAYPEDEKKPLKIMIIGFEGTASESLLNELRDTPLLQLSETASPIKRLKRMLPKSGHERKHIDAQTSAQLVWDLLSACALAEREHQSPQDKLVHQAMDIMHRQLTTISMESLAEELMVSRMHLSRCFNAYHGISPGAWLKQLKLDTAKDLLRDPNITIDAIASRVGYSNATTFIAAFKDSFDTTPNRWRQSVT